MENLKENNKPQRIVFVDTETTGKNFNEDRVVEIALIETIDGVETGKVYHSYVNPEGKIMSQEVIDVHKLTNEFLEDKPTFQEISDDVIDFLKDSVFVAHNAPFDLTFINSELKRIGYDKDIRDIVLSYKDTLPMAKKLYPGKSVKLDKVLDYCGIDRTERDEKGHSALLDTQLLVKAYNSMQELLKNYHVEDLEVDKPRRPIKYFTGTQINILPIQVSPEDEKKNQDYLKSINSPFAENTNDNSNNGPKPTINKM